jgi:hypothetical protein
MLNRKYKAYNSMAWSEREGRGVKNDARSLGIDRARR